MPRTSDAETDANFVMTGDGRIVEVQGTAEKIPFTEEQLLDAARARQEGRRQARRSAEAGGDVSAPHRQLTGPARHRDPQSRQAAGDARAARALRHRGRLGRRARPAEPEETGASFRDNARIKAQAAASATELARLRRRFRARGRRARRRARHPFRALGRRGQGFRPRHGNDRIDAARPRRRPPGAAHGAIRVGALRRLAGRPRRGIRGHRRGHAGLAAARRPPASATTRCSCPTAMRAPSAR